MIFFQTLLVVLYIYLIIQNYNRFKNNNITLALTIVTTVLATVMLFSSNTANFDWSEVELDMSGYRTVYEKYDVLEHPDFKMYYVFYSSMYIGQQLGMSFRVWWGVMSVIAMCVVLFACKIHKFSFNLFLATFMAYYEMVFYSGFKFFYGFCVFLWAFGFLLRNTNKDKIIFAIITCLAGGLHVMYYFFLIFLLKPIKKPKAIVNIIVIVTIFFTTMMRLSGSAAAFMAPFFSALDNEHISGYTLATVNMGFYIAVILHLIVVFAIIKMRNLKKQVDPSNVSIDTLYYLVLLSLLFIPFYAIALTFMRLITSFSLVALVASSCIMINSKKERALCRNMSILIVSSFLLMQLLISYGSPRGFIEVSIKPFFDVL
ncbi:EpsG family protein [Butyricimonas virosa]|uniref:EpsG family protein n=1 Tax=Butyricimonas virosa TaxID=544645 RepID=UPI0022E04569|nr:EpsG family protein [Butyricimonas virosa]